MLPTTADSFATFSSTACTAINYATGEKGTPLDFIAFHAKGGPSVVDGHVRMGIAQQLRAINNSMEIVASFPELKNTPIVIGESDPDGCAACNSQVYPQNNYRNGVLYASYTAASFARKHDLARRNGVNLKGALNLGFRIRGPAVFFRLSNAGDQRDRQAGAQRLPDV